MAYNILKDEAMPTLQDLEHREDSRPHSQLQARVPKSVHTYPRERELVAMYELPICWMQQEQPAGVRKEALILSGPLHDYLSPHWRDILLQMRSVTTITNRRGQRIGDTIQRARLPCRLCHQMLRFLPELPKENRTE